MLDLIGFLFFDFVYVAAVVNYAAQSEMNIYLLDAIKKLVQDKGYPGNGLEASIKVCTCVVGGPSVISGLDWTAMPSKPKVCYCLQMQDSPEQAGTSSRDL